MVAVEGAPLLPGEREGPFPLDLGKLLLERADPVDSSLGLVT
jgi:hypothetical protein